MTSPISLFVCFTGTIETYDYTLAVGSLTGNVDRWSRISECNPAAGQDREMALFTKVYDELISRIQQSLLVYVPGLTTLSSRKFGNSLPMDACFLVLEPHFCCPIGLCKLHPINFGFSTLRVAQDRF